MQGLLRRLLLWGPLALSLKNWVLDVAPVSGLCLRPVSRPDVVAESEWVLVQKYGVRVLGRFRRGDVVYLRSLEDPTRHWVRRLAGIEGDWVSDHGHIRKVPQGHCWLDGSSVKGVHSYADCAVPLALLEGRVSHIIWPPSRMGEVESYVPPGRVIRTADRREPAARK
ncbi:unnamed protein product [Ostreobium quekettii]|uniref:Mitochondrial inner membrane protease subunit 2 n=1 Tax=Ostreobium quekettii TaxID=121088 RepID=A0A8S1IR03_9CHLO|nr:unnamed protein product [Ostreobium quekettii]|eukprot:evm.model.scf_38EXC.1 EVM.evm.TU.scf_38EXC.1   scf_38EXC:3747-5959(-)